jgi:WD40 repeat protein
MMSVNLANHHYAVHEHCTNCYCNRFAHTQGSQIAPFRTLEVLDVLEAHQKGASVMTSSPDGQFIATGGADGLIGLWRVYEQQVRGFLEAVAVLLLVPVTVRHSAPL